MNSLSKKICLKFALISIQAESEDKNELFAGLQRAGDTAKSSLNNTSREVDHWKFCTKRATGFAAFLVREFFAKTNLNNFTIEKKQVNIRLYIYVCTHTSQILAFSIDIYKDRLGSHFVGCRFKNLSVLYVLLAFRVKI